jgi:hypothetical protein
MTEKNAQAVSWAAITALVFSLCSLGLSSYQAYITRRAQRLSVTPRVHLDFSRNNTADATIHFINRGIGPAEVKALTVKLDGTPQTSWRNMLFSVGVAHIGELTYGRYPAGTFYPAGFSGVLIKVTGPEAVAAFTKAFNRMTIQVCYCSLYDDCWRFQLPQYSTVAAPEGCPVVTREMDE